MSQSITLIGRYRNNKTTSIGSHNPHNNRVINNEEITHFSEMIKEHFEPNLWKFKALFCVTYLQSGKKVSIEYLPTQTSLNDIQVNEIYRLTHDTTY